MENLKKIQSVVKYPILIKKKENLFYLQGRSLEDISEEYLLILPENNPKSVIALGSGLEKIDWCKKSDSLRNISKYLKGYSKLEVEYGFTYGEGKYLEMLLLGQAVKIVPALSVVDAVRAQKNKDELVSIKISMEIVSKVFTEVKKWMKKTDFTEIVLAKKIEDLGIRFGAEGLAFPVIVAAGENSAIPHHRSSKRKIKKGEPIVLDFGFKYRGYCSDFTRTVFLQSVPKKFEMVYNAVEEAYLSAMVFFEKKAKISGGDMHDCAVGVLTKYGLNRFFTHSLGHGTGLEIHESPYLGPKSKEILRDGMVFSIEPGVYLPKKGGVRIEDLVFVNGGKIQKFIDVATSLRENVL